MPAKAKQSKKSQRSAAGGSVASSGGDGKASKSSFGNAKGIPLAQPAAARVKIEFVRAKRIDQSLVVRSRRNPLHGSVHRTAIQPGRSQYLRIISPTPRIATQKHEGANAERKASRTINTQHSALSTHTTYTMRARAIRSSADFCPRRTFAASLRSGRRASAARTTAPTSSSSSTR